MSWTIAAVCGGASNARANGSLFFRIAPVRVRISNLYFSPSARSGTNISQMPPVQKPHRRARGRPTR